jgi:peptide/nickel transport system substrate-binding protein
MEARDKASEPAGLAIPFARPAVRDDRLEGSSVHQRLAASLAMFAIGGTLLVAGFASAASSRPSTASGEQRRGGTLRVDLASDFDYIDPALAWFSHSWQLGYHTEAKLVNLPDREANQGGMRIIPEVAKSLPAISRDGLTYTFNLKNTYRFHTGARITAANFVAAFNRNAQKRMNAPAIIFMDDIAGANEVYAGFASRVSGVRAFGRHRLQIRLTKNAPDFLARLTMPFFSAIPLNTPIEPEGVDAPAGFGGPYYVESWDKGRSAVLVRNRFYRGPRPSNPDRIVYNIGIALDAQRLRCERGESDVCGFPPAQAAELHDKYGVNRGRLFVKHQPVAWFLNFNHDDPLFRGNNRLKRAVNYAIDRPQMVRQHGALGGARTDQILPIDSPGYRDWNIYPLRGPNLTRARRLADENARRGGKVRLWTFNSSFGPSVAQVVQFNLKQIGLDADITAFPRIVQFERAHRRSSNDFDLLLNGWGEDYPDPNDFINFLLEGTTISEQGHNINLSYFDEPKWNRRMQQANGQFGAQRLRTYAILDRDLMRGPAPVAPYINTNARILVSARVGCYVFHQAYGSIWGPLCLRG